MKVRELIEALGAEDPDAVVVILSNSEVGEYSEVEGISRGLFLLHSMLGDGQWWQDGQRFGPSDSERAAAARAIKID